ncbi:HAMP domain-containing methyl-accepting chemotaxis protein [Jidongwangia harbinensis]|uniref:HAMP domain-containing methyl-accepting chemotaxis protein n=1 Tax=Jidongwangia harbinensis TaxID=2878561 RepID=UPI001CD9AD3B|nr:methyl-accepting chemotaxis protein [Jidongwangia harbinensis]MCA2212081.1 methyl-accepting chemotaxis protein [Jidongwangia harbinensis]
MMAGRTFGNKLAGGFGLTVALTLLMGAASVLALTVVVNSKDDVITAAADGVTGAERLHTTAERRIGNYRAYLLNGRQDYLDATRADRTTFLDQVAELRGALTDPTAVALLDDVSRSEERHSQVLDPVLERRRAMKNLTTIAQLQATEVAPSRLALQNAISALTERTRADVQARQRASSVRATQAIVVIVVLGLLAMLSAALIAYRLNRDLRREVGAAVGHIQSSSAELEAAAAQQATGGRDQASAMSEITTTISELLITSRQIAESAQRVSKIAEDTADAAATGDATIDQTRQSIAAIRTQVDLIVQHMLALGEKSQQIGGVVDLVSELAEQTNILAINATIEATGAGEWGRRFAVVADEIRKLADRTAGSAKEIRALIDDVRGAVNTTVMATEIGAKSVDAGARQFDDATGSFRRIAHLVATTNDATREIELSTKQQTTAVEQVNVAASDTARVTRETEASATQTRQTAAHLSKLSGDLLELVGTGKHG